MKIALLSVLSLAACATDLVDEDERAFPVAANAIHPNYTVSIGGCNGIILNGRWVLTTARCIGTPGAQTRTIRYAINSLISEVLWSGPVQTFVHPDAGVGATIEELAWHDVGLIHLYQRGIDMEAKGIEAAQLLSDTRAPGRDGEEPKVRTDRWGNSGCTGTGTEMHRSGYFELLTFYGGQGFAAWSEFNPTPGLCTAYDRGAPLMWTKGGVDLVAGWYSGKARTAPPSLQLWTYFSEAKDNYGWVASTIAANTSTALDTATATGKAYSYDFRRQDVTAPALGRIENSGKCLQRSGNTVTVQLCTTTDAQKWHYTVVGQIETPDGACLTKFTDIVTGATTLRVSPCSTSAANQVFYTTTAPTLRTETGTCVTASAIGSTPTTELCSTVAAQKWSIVNGASHS